MTSEKWDRLRKSEKSREEEREKRERRESKREKERERRLLVIGTLRNDSPFTSCRTPIRHLGLSSSERVRAEIPYKSTTG
jgi:hypothetical protein